MLIRDFEIDDLSQVIRLFERAVRETNSRDYSSVQVRAWAPETADVDSWKQRLCGGTVWLCETSGQIAGFIRLEDDGHIDLLYVHPDFQRLGIASGLLEKAFRWASSRQLPRLFTESSITARPFFHSCFRFWLGGHAAKFFVVD